MAMQGTLLEFILGWLMIPWRIFVEIYRHAFPPANEAGEHEHEGMLDASSGDITIDKRELSHWTKLSQQWWDPEGDFALLHGFNHCRIPMILDAYSKYIAQKPLPDTNPLRGAKIIDVGCGAGFVSEPLREYGADITGVDMVPAVIELAKAHWNERHPTEIGPDYLCTSVEEISSQRPEEFDMVLCLEVLDHVANWKEFAAQSCRLLRPGGCAIFSTINRTLAALIIAIIGGEHLLRIVPMDTHHLRKFIKPSEVEYELNKHGLVQVNLTGCTPVDPWARRPRWSDVSYCGVTYAITAVKRA
ncbi:ubiquinone biosynthesis O-methyltransferase-like [Paramacrobiotus metropolitanus]|uniref:ubiquinone biosynthesis O-methyltransferase-like n=1 Tax=Paramacrobiotus metropolitanus TaxID=2943436 RepID=UPI002445CE80|nr:ubiquinone biosynthesis O-methyltransferase-like [Paramacrobiotus metropolitanus]